MHKVAFKHDHENTEKYAVQEDNTLDSIVEAKCQDYGDWKALARFNIGTDEPGEVNRWLDETVGIKTINEREPNKTVLKPAQGLPAEILIPQAWTQEGFEVYKTHEITLEKVKPPAAIGIDKLDKWFIPKEEECDITYTLEGLKECADKVHLEIYGSNYCDSTDWNKGLGTFDTMLPDEPLCVMKDLKADERSAGNELASKWKGKVEPIQGVLSNKTDGEDRHINVAFSPYTIHLRYFKDEPKDAKARIALEPFWPQFQANGNVMADSLKINWEVKETDRLTRGRLLVFDKGEKVVFRTPIPAGKLAKGVQKYDEWDGSYLPGVTNTKGGAKVILEDMPYRVQIQAHAKENEENGLAVAAMHTEVRLYVHPGTHPLDLDPYVSSTDKPSLDISLADLYHKDAAPTSAADAKVWTKFALAGAGFHPGPVNDANTNTEFETALKEFQRSVFKWRPGGVGDFERLQITAGGNDDNDTKDALENLPDKLKRPWFGKEADRTDYDITAEEFKDDLKEPSKTMILWVDDRHWYTDPDWLVGSDDVTPKIRDTVTGHPTALGNTRGPYGAGDARVAKDAVDIARPWMPLQAGFRLLGKDKKLDEELAGAVTQDIADATMRAIGPLRVDWTFDEIGGDAIAVPEVDTGLYHKERTRTKSALEWALDGLKKVHPRKDVKRRATYFNCPEANGGIRPDNLADYFKQPFGLDGKSLLPWTAKEEPSRESVITVVHGNLGQGADDLHKKRMGRAGVYFHPSRIAGDGYQVRAQVRFEKTGDYEFPNLECLKGRYPRLPQAHTAKMRLWRKSSIRGYLCWGDTNSWAASRSEFKRFYTSSHVHFVNEQGAADNELDLAVNSLFDDLVAFRGMVKETVKNTAPANQRHTDAWITITANRLWPWSQHKQFGVIEASNANTPKGWTAQKQLLDDYMHPYWYKYSVRLGSEIARTIERKKGWMRGHVIVEFRATDDYYHRKYSCPTCNDWYYYLEKNRDAPAKSNEPCPTPLCGGRLRPAPLFGGYYRCGNGHDFFCEEADSNGGGHTDPCAEANCGQALNPVQVPREQYRCNTCGFTAFYEEAGTGGTHVGEDCPYGAPCGGKMYPVAPVNQWLFEEYECDRCNHVESFWETDIAGGTHDGEQHCRSRVRRTVGRFRRKAPPATGQDHSALLANGNKVRILPPLAIKDGENFPVSSIGNPIGVAFNFAGGYELWGHEVGHTRYFEHAGNAPGANDAQHDARDNTAVNWAGLPTPETNANSKRWDRACLMTYVSHLASYDNTKDKACFCFKCILKNRGWKIDAMGNPPSNVHDP